MEKREVERKSTRTVPVIIENHENAAKKTKLMVPSSYTAGHLINILRSRMHILPYHPVYLFLKSKQSPVLTSKTIGHLHHKHRDEKGLLRLIHAGQASFGFRGNIRAIRFRQKWIENLHNTLHQHHGGPQSHSGSPPPHFPLEPPSAPNLGAPLDVDDLNDSLETPLLDDFYQDFMGYSFIEMEEESNFLNSLPPSGISAFPSTSALADTSQSSGLIYSTSAMPDGTDPFESSYLADPWVSFSSAYPWLSSATENSGQNSGAAISLPSPNQEEIESFAYEIELQNLQNISGSSSGLVNATANVQNSQGPNLSLYESDSDFYDTDNDE